MAATDLPRSQGHPFYDALDAMLGSPGFDRYVKERCEEFYADRTGRASSPPETYVRRLLMDYFEGTDSQRDIVWRCSDSLALRSLLGLDMTDRVADYSSLTYIRQRLPLSIHEEVFVFVLSRAHEDGLVRGRTVGVDATTLEANAAMNSIVRKDTGKDWKAYFRDVVEEEEGIDDPDDDEIRRYDRQRGSRKKVSNKDWESRSDPEARITRLKDRRTGFAYKAEHVVDLENEVILSATISAGSRSDVDSFEESMEVTRQRAEWLGMEGVLAEAVADRGYHRSSTLAAAESAGLRTYIPERKEKQNRKWRNKPPEWERAFRGNRRRVNGRRGRKLQRMRAAVLERSFALTCIAGGAGRTRLRGRETVQKRYLIVAAGRNLGILLRYHFGFGTQRSLQGIRVPVVRALESVYSHVQALTRSFRRPVAEIASHFGALIGLGTIGTRIPLSAACSTDS